ncbi:glycosyltransferase family 2 protein [Alcaligenaceae bacterium C4P045]|nr:glycosyltransferase family 2 protein [Alcaligenaceae bacterium C4P045]
MHIESRPDALFPELFSAESTANAVSTRADGSVFYDSHVSVLVPGLNEAANLRVMLPTLMLLLNRTCRNWEIVVVDDGSTDDTPQLMAEWTTVPGFRYLQLSRNFGKEAAISAGLDSCDGDVVICMDADMQHPPALIPDMLARWKAGSDMVYAVRENRDDETWFKRQGAKWFYRLVSGGQRVDVPAHAGDFRLMDRKVVNALNALPERTRFMKGLYAWVGFKTEAFPYTPADRIHGESKFTPVKLIKLAMSGVTAFTTWPLRMLSLVGFMFALVSFGYGAYLVAEYFEYGHQVDGWTTIVCALLFFAGINMVSLGVVGEYVGRIFDEVKGRPLYVVRDRLGRAARTEPSAE